MTRYIEGYELEDSDLFIAWHTGHPEVNGAGETQDEALERLGEVEQTLIERGE